MSAIPTSLFCSVSSSAAINTPIDRVCRHRTIIENLLVDVQVRTRVGESRRAARTSALAFGSKSLKGAT